ncbi:MAG: aldo/keto reductase [Salibacteraceae bacterium]|jgi:voltage-dependent potassium channel beta subunit|nr:aldo/keto reductase [Salibacteraceae bacterium]MDP4686026.1 aldo/keto reductase [Salibacteraceae bacterium]MDP4843682.1 aldo/keto reductase [Salibacteraceae bacterium]MDP4935448.1 aldo/keto reductase [Salibacteraceae bacterium]MDP4963667.1 aldo/keto reductase [Salibacteraceae bacterium]
MEYRRLGKAGVKVSALSFGSWITFGNQVGDSTADECISYAYDNGINFFDNAEVYANGESEVVMGKLLKSKSWNRDTYLVSSKVFWGGELPTQKGLSRKHVVEACHAALKRLQVEYLDFYFCHRPDKETPMEETVWTMHNLITQGKILYWGTSEWSAQEIQEAFMVARQYNLIPPAMEQPQYNMFVRSKVEVEFDKLFRDYGYGSTIWSPLASGILTGKYNNGTPEDARLNRGELNWLKDRMLNQANLDKVAKLGEIASALDTSLANLAIAWCLKNPHVSTVLTGATKLDQLKQNLKSLDIVPKLTEDVLESIEIILDNKPAKPQY